MVCTCPFRKYHGGRNCSGCCSIYLTFVGFLTSPHGANGLRIVGKDWPNRYARLLFDFVIRRKTLPNTEHYLQVSHRMVVGKNKGLTVHAFHSISQMPPESDYDRKIENQASFRLSVYVLGFVIISSVLLAINTWMIFSLAQGISKLLPQIPNSSILVQLLIFIGPMVLLFLEWFAWDVIYANRALARKSRGP